MQNRNRRNLGAVLVVAITALLAGCSSDASTRSVEASGGPTTTHAQVAVPDEIPAGTTLRFGDQLGFLQTILRVGGEDQDFPYEVEYADFVGGPPMLQAFQGGALDAGFVASTPLVFAHAAGQEITAVAGWAPESGAAALVSVDADVDDWGDLKGKRIAYQRGTSLEAGLLVGLDEAGLLLDDVTTVDVPLTQVKAALQSGSADAGISTEPLTTGLLTAVPDARVVAPADEITDRATFLIATRGALADEGRSAALADYTARLVRAFERLRADPELIAQAIYVEQYGLPVERARELSERSGGTSFLDLPDDVVGAQQRLADLFAAAGQIPDRIQVDQQFDDRFAQLIRDEEGR